jgi:hypothetical protein
MKTAQIFMLDSEGKVPKTEVNPYPIARYELQFLNNDGSHTAHKVEVKNMNFQDIIRHLNQGDSVLITPRLREDLDRMERDRGSWYFTHA